MYFKCQINRALNFFSLQGRLKITVEKKGALPAIQRVRMAGFPPKNGNRVPIAGAGGVGTIFTGFARLLRQLHRL